MHSKLTRDKMVMDVCMRFAATKTKSKKATDVLDILVKLAQSGDMWDQMLKLPDAKIKEVLGDNKPYESKKELLRNILTENIDKFTSYVIEKAKTPAIEDYVAAYMPEKWIDAMVSDFLPDYNGTNASNFQIKGALIGVLNNAWKRERKEVKKPGEGDLDGPNQPDPVSPEPSPEDILIDKEVKPAEKSKVKLLLEQFNIVFESEDTDIFTLYIQEKLEPELLEEIEKLKVNQVNNPAQAEADFDHFFETTLKFISDNMHKKKEIPGSGGQHMKYTVQDIQNAVNNTVNTLDFDKLLEHILNSKFYNIPKVLRATLEKEPRLVRSIMKHLIKSTLVLEAKKNLQVSLPGAKKRQSNPDSNQGGRVAASHIAIMYHMLVKDIKKMESDPQEISRLFNETLQILGSRANEQGKVKHREKSGLNSTFFQHVTPMVMSGLIHQAEEEYGENFKNLSEEQKYKIISEIHSKIYPGLPHPIPHKTKMPQKSYKELGDLETANDITKKALMDRINAAQEIARGERSEGMLMPFGGPTLPQSAKVPKTPTPNVNTGENIDLQKESQLMFLMKKYCSRALIAKENNAQQTY